MGIEPQSVGILPGDADRDDPEGLGRLAHSLADRGFAVEVLDAGGHAACSRREVPAVMRRWRRFWSVRRLAGRAEPRPAILHARGLEQAETGLDLAERWRVPYLVEIDEFLKPGERLRLSRRWCRGVIATNPDLADELIRALRLPARIVSTIAPGMAVHEPREGSRRPGCVPVVGAASGFGLGSGLPIFLEAARQVLKTGIDAEFVIAAGGSAATVRLLAEGLQIADRITLAEGGDAGPSFWAVLDLYCHPARMASTGKSLATAMAHGIPSIATDVKGLGLWIEDETIGTIVPAGDSGALAATMLELLSDPSRAGELGRKSRERIARAFSIGARVDALVTLYRAAAASHEGVFPRVRVDGAGGSTLASRFS